MKQTEGRVLAGIDIGTLTCRLLVAKVSGDGVLTELQAERKVLRLGEGFAHSHRLGQVAMSRVIETLRGWRQVIEGLSVEGEVAVATSAVREAVNRQEFLQLARMEAGFDVEVLGGEEEARRTMLGIRSGCRLGCSFQRNPALLRYTLRGARRFPYSCRLRLRGPNKYRHTELRDMRGGQ